MPGIASRFARGELHAEVPEGEDQVGSNNEGAGTASRIIAVDAFARGSPNIGG